MEEITDKQVIKRLGDSDRYKKIEKIVESGNFNELWVEYVKLALSFVELRDEYRELEKEIERPSGLVGLS